MKHAWRHGTAPKCTAEVPEFVERHVHDNYVLTAGVKSLPIHRHLLHVERPTILRKPPHTVHKTLRGGGQRKAPPPDRISGHPYKHAAAIASSRRRHRTDDDTATIGGDSDDERQAAPPAPSLFGVAGVIGGPEFDPYQQYRHNIYPFKEQLAHEVNKLVLEKENLDRVRKQAAAASRHRRHHHHGAADDDDDDNTDSSMYDGGSDTETLMSSSTLIDEDDDEYDDEEEEEDILPVD